MKLDKRDGRSPETPRPVEMTVGFHRLAEGSVLYRAGGTVVLATASVDDGVPRFLEGQGRGWLTAEYQMHPRANPRRREARDGRSRPVSGRSKEIERLIGRSLRAAVNFETLGERTIAIDCDVLEADGGTRTASITAGWVALALASHRLYVQGKLPRPLLVDQVAAISAGHVDDQLVLDLCYAEDSTARVDMNVVATGKGNVVELQATAEGRAISRSEMDRLVDLALTGIDTLCEHQRRVLQSDGVEWSRVLAQ